MLKKYLNIIILLSILPQLCTANSNSTINVSGKVWVDENSNGVNDDERFYTGIGCFVIVTGKDGKTISSTAIDNNGSFSIPVEANVFGMNIQICSKQCLIGSTPKMACPPIGYFATTSTSYSLNTKEVDVSDKNFGIKLNPHAISIVNITGSKNKNTIDLEWQTNNRENPAIYQIERSKDGENFELITKLKTKDFFPGEYSYKFTDASPLLVNSYYRLKIIKRDGKYVYSPTILVSKEISQTNELIDLSNPFDKVLFFQYSSNKEDLIELRLFDAKGKAVNTITNPVHAGYNIVELDNLTNLPVDVYYLHVYSTTNKTYCSRVIKVD